jgi:hypothetical protein
MFTLPDAVGVAVTALPSEALPVEVGGGDETDAAGDGAEVGCACALE